MSRMVGSRKEEFERIKRHHEAFAANKWNMQGMEPEPRVCMILNRFSQNLIIIYASPACEHIFNIDPENIVGKPILLFVRADDLASFVEQMDMVKASTAIANIRFWFQSPRLQQEIPCEAIVFGAADGVMVVMRQCRPFIRKRFIGSRDHYRTSASAAAAANSYKSGSHRSSWTSASSASPSSVSSEASLLSMSPPLPRQDRQHVVAADDLNKSTNLPRSLPMSMISRIQILDLDQNSDDNNCKSKGAHNTRGNIRHLTGLKDNPLPVKHGLDLPERFGLKVYNVQDYVEEQDDDDITSEDIYDINDYGANSDPRSNTRRGCDMELNIS
ncbi:hypothetical protein BGZ98_001238 [Dissophora globulifera]|nr:hypothetical protein BGZ98_001238 [Dissophora globulifera]